MLLRTCERTNKGSADAGLCSHLARRTGEESTQEGTTPIEQLVPGDLVLSRSEFDNGTGPVEPRRVEEVFVREGRLLELTIAGHKLVTTPEHPFYVKNDGWIPAGDLRPGDLLSTNEGDWLPVEGNESLGRWSTVYNLRVKNFHAYFVQVAESGLLLWVHNSYARTKGTHLNTNSAIGNFGVYEIVIHGSLYKIGKSDLERVTALSGLPTRLHQQVRKLERIFGVGNVIGKVVTNLGNVTTGAAKQAERAHVLNSFRDTGFVPLGNWKSFRP